MDQKVTSIFLIKSIISNYRGQIARLKTFNVEIEELENYIRQKERIISNLEILYREDIHSKDWDFAIQTLAPIDSLLNIYNDYLRIERGLMSSNNWKKNRQTIIDGFEKIMPDITKLDGILRELKSKL